MKQIFYILSIMVTLSSCKSCKDQCNEDMGIPDPNQTGTVIVDGQQIAMPSTFIDAGDHPWLNGDCWVVSAAGSFNDSYPDAYTMGGEPLYAVTAKYDVQVQGLSNLYWNEYYDSQSIKIYVTRQQRIALISIMGPNFFSFDSRDPVYKMSLNGPVWYLAYQAF